MQALATEFFDTTTLFATVQEILEDVRKRGDKALKEITLHFDKVKLDKLEVTKEEIAEAERAMVFYESTHRILKTLKSLSEYTPTFKIVIGREITKQFEQFVEGSPEEILNYFSSNSDKQRGEFVVIVEPK